MQQIFSIQDLRIKKIYTYFEDRNYPNVISQASFYQRDPKKVLEILNKRSYTLYQTEISTGRSYFNKEMSFYKDNHFIIVNSSNDLDDTPSTEDKFEIPSFNDNSSVSVHFYASCIEIEKEDIFNELFDTFLEIPIINNLFLVAATPNGSLYTKSFKLNKKEINIDLDLNYNEDFTEIHKLIEERIHSTSNGIIIFHGKPGTGKTSYIKWLLQNVNKKVIFLPPYLVYKLTSPQFIEFLQEECANSLLIIEDAEEILKSRDSGYNSTISTILNISDGLLSEAFNIQILATLNCSIDEVDSALQRKGRIIAQYEFKELDKKRAQKLSDKLGFNSIITKDTLLTDVFNQNEKSFKEDKYKIGV